MSADRRRGSTDGLSSTGHARAQPAPKAVRIVPVAALTSSTRPVGPPSTPPRYTQLAPARAYDPTMRTPTRSAPRVVTLESPTDERAMLQAIAESAADERARIARAARRDDLGRDGDDDEGALDDTQRELAFQAAHAAWPERREARALAEAERVAELQASGRYHAPPPHRTVAAIELVAKTPAELKTDADADARKKAGRRRKTPSAKSSTKSAKSSTGSAKASTGSAKASRTGKTASGGR